MLWFATMTKVRAKLNFVGIFTPDQPNDAFVVPLQCIDGIPERKPHEQSASSAVERSPQSMEKRSAALNRGLPRPAPAARRDPTLGFSRRRPARITSHIGRLLQIFEWVGREQQRLNSKMRLSLVSSVLVASMVQAAPGASSYGGPAKQIASPPSIQCRTEYVVRDELS